MKKQVLAVLVVVLAVVLDCSVTTVHPPNGNDIPVGYSTLSFGGTTGIVSVDEGVEAFGQLAVAERTSCETLMADIRSIVSLAGCSMSATQFSDQEGTNESRLYFSAQFVCAGARDGVIRTLADLATRAIEPGGPPGTLALLSRKAPAEPRLHMSRRASTRPDGH